MGCTRYLAMTVKQYFRSAARKAWPYKRSSLDEHESENGSRANKIYQIVKKVKTKLTPTLFPVASGPDGPEIMERGGIKNRLGGFACGRKLCLIRPNWFSKRLSKYRLSAANNVPGPRHKTRLFSTPRTNQPQQHVEMANVRDLHLLWWGEKSATQKKKLKVNLHFNGPWCA